MQTRVRDRLALFGLPMLALVLSAAPLAAAPRAILDYRKENAARPKAYPAATRQALAKALAEGGQKEIADALGGDFVILGDAQGAFSRRGANEQIYLLARNAPVAADPFPPDNGQVLVAMADGRLGAVYKLSPKLQYQRIAAALDSDGDGIGEVLLEASAFNMGQSVTSVDLLALGQGGTTSIRQSLREVVYDGCDNPRGKKEKRVSTISLGGDGKLVAKDHPLKCR